MNAPFRLPAPPPARFRPSARLPVSSPPGPLPERASTPAAAHGPARRRAPGWSGSIAGALLFAAFIVLLPWEAVRGAPFADVPNYVTRIELLRLYGPGYFAIASDWIGRLGDEYAWFLLLRAIADLPFEPAVSLAALSAFTAGAFFLFLSRLTGPVVAFAGLANPIVIDLLSSQLRSAFAMALFLLALMVLRRVSFVVLAAGALAFLHTSMIVTGALFVGAVVLTRLPVARDVTMVATGAAAAVAALAIGIGAPIVLEMMGDRRAGVAFETKSLLYIAFWPLFGGLLLTAMTGLCRLHWFVVYAALLALAVPAIELTGFPGFRFIALGYPVMMAAVACLDRGAAGFAALGLALYQACLWVYWVT